MGRFILSKVHQAWGLKALHEGDFLNPTLGQGSQAPGICILASGRRLRSLLWAPCPPTGLKIRSASRHCQASSLPKASLDVSDIFSLQSGLINHQSRTPWLWHFKAIGPSARMQEERVETCVCWSRGLWSTQSSLPLPCLCPSEDRTGHAVNVGARTQDVKHALHICPLLSPAFPVAVLGTGLCGAGGRFLNLPAESFSPFYHNNSCIPHIVNSGTGIQWTLAFPDVPSWAEWPWARSCGPGQNRKARETKQTVGLNYREENHIIDLFFKGICLQGAKGEICWLQMEISTAKVLSAFAT